MNQRSPEYPPKTSLRRGFPVTMSVASNAPPTSAKAVPFPMCSWSARMTAGSMSTNRRTSVHVALRNLCTSAFGLVDESRAPTDCGARRVTKRINLKAFTVLPRLPNDLALGCDRATDRREGVILPRFRGHPPTREDAQGVIHGEAEAKSIRPGVQSGGGT